MSHAILHSLISQRCAHWTHCCTHTHYRTEQETTYTVPETTTRQKSLVKDHLHSFLVASAPSRKTLIYQNWAVVPFLTLGWGQESQGAKQQLYFAVIFSFQLPDFLALFSHRARETSVCCLFSPVLLPFLEEGEGGRRERGTHVVTQSAKALQVDRGAAVCYQMQSCCVPSGKAVPVQRSVVPQQAVV